MNLFEKFIYLNRNDRQALLAILFVFILSATMIFIVGNIDTAPQDKLSTTLDSTRQKASRQDPAYYKEGINIYELFSFDPNTASEKDFCRLGLEAWQARSIVKYRNKGGIFRTPRDFARVYGLSKKQFETLLPYIIIGEDFQPAAKFYPREKYSDYPKETAPTIRRRAKDTVQYSYPRKIKEGTYIDINKADTTELQKIPGIGTFYAKKIVRYREQLGGFVSTRQILEVEGIPESVISFMSINTHEIKKININTLSVTQLRKHPYLNFYQAKEISDYRRKYGPLKSIEELKLLKEFPPAEIERLKPYISY